MSLLLAVLGIIAATSGQPVESGAWTRGDAPTLARGGVVWIATPATVYNVRIDQRGAVRRITEEPR